jgi:hypothetical protein
VLVRSSGEKGMDIDCHTVEFDDVRYHIQVSSVLRRVLICSKNSGRWANYWQQMDATQRGMGLTILASIQISVEYLG